MGRLTLRLPESLHQKLINLSENEGVSLNQYIVYALATQVASKYTVSVTSIQERSQQQQNFQDLIKRLGETDLSDVKEILQNRETVQPESELSQDLINRLKMKIEQQSNSQTE